MGGHNAVGTPSGARRGSAEGKIALGLQSQTSVRQAARQTSIIVDLTPRDIVCRLWMAFRGQDNIDCGATNRSRSAFHNGRCENSKGELQLYMIGDVHGQLDRLDRVIAAIHCDVEVHARRLYRRGAGIARLVSGADRLQCYELARNRGRCCGWPFRSFSRSFWGALNLRGCPP
jgi:hypothetical protein